MKRTFITALLLTASLSATAADYYLVVPVNRSAVPPPAPPAPVVSVSLNSFSLPDGTVGVPYAGFNLNELLVVTGAADYTGSGVTWSVAAGALPAGIELRADGTLAGQPSAPGKAAFTVTAAYRNVTGQRAYDILVARRTAGIKLDGLLANYAMAPGAPSWPGNIPLSEFNGPGQSTSLTPSASFTGAADLKPTSGFFNYSTGVVAGAGDVSVGAWIRTTSNASQRIIQQRSNGNDTTTINGQFITSLSAGRFCYSDGSNTAFGATVCHSKQVTDGQWHHVGFVRPSSGGVRLYVDGLKQSFSYPVRTYQLRPGLSIGYDQRDNSSGLAGGIADVWIFGRALSDAEFGQAYSSSAPLQ